MKFIRNMVIFTFLLTCILIGKSSPSFADGGKTIKESPTLANGMQDAVQIDLDKPQTGVLEDSASVDYYKITLPSDGNLKLSIKNVYDSVCDVSILTSDFIPDYYWVDENVNLHFGGQAELLKTSNNYKLNDGYSESQVGLKKGTYYIKVINGENAVGKTYNFLPSFTPEKNYETEYNDTYDYATEMNLNELYSGSVTKFNEVDCYKFTLLNDGTISINMTQKLGEAYNVYVRDPKGGVKLKFFTVGDNHHAVENITKKVTLSKGTYYYEVRPQFGLVTLSFYNIKTDFTDISKTPYLKSSPLKSSQIIVKNYEKNVDTIIVKNIKKADIVKIYNAAEGGKLLAVHQSAGSSGTYKLELAKKSGKIYVSITHKGLIESNRTAVTFKVEKNKCSVICKKSNSTYQNRKL